MKSVVARLGLALVAAAWAGAAQAATTADKPAYGPPPAWVDVPPTPDIAITPDQPALKTLFDDNQSRLSPDGDTFYNRRVIKVTKPEGLGALTTESFTWNPDTETLTINAIAIHRGGQLIDLLGNGDKILVLRREQGLEAGALDGRLTATRQLEGLEAGDVVDYSWTMVSHDPVVHGRSQDYEGLSAGVTERYRTRITWPSSEPVRWKATDGFGAPTLTTEGGRTTLLWDARNVEPPTPPVGAPPRYAAVGRLYVTSFTGWPEVSDLIWPLFDRAATLDPASPLKAEAAAIAARTSDPKARAFAALQLVESRVRYFFIGTDDGGYVPAGADETWTRKFGDCKGKTVLLLALLRELKIDAEPVLVSTTFNDGLDDRLPGLSAFNHVLVRATIDGKVYWLDGTRQGDASGLDLLGPTPWRWGLPLKAGGSPLVAIPLPPITEPQMSVKVTIDARKGLDTPAAAEIDIRMTGDLALVMRAAAAAAPKAELARRMREGFAKGFDWIEATDITFSDDPVRNAFEFKIVGKADMDWTMNPDLHLREYRFPNTTQTTTRMFPNRDAGAHTDAPFAVPYPFYVGGVIEVMLPDGGKGFTVIPRDDNLVIGGLEMKSFVGIVDGTARFSGSARSVVQEVSAADAQAANKTIRRMGERQDYIRAPASLAGKTD